MSEVMVSMADLILLSVPGYLWLFPEFGAELPQTYALDRAATGIG
jgi:hypothetical protein